MTAAANIQAKQSSEWLTPTDKRILKYLAFGLGSVILGGSGYLSIRHFVRKARSGKAEQQSLTDGTPENYAKRILMGFENDGFPGTDEDAIRRVFLEVPDLQTFAKVATKYEEITKQPKGALYKDLSDKLSTSEYYEMQSILKGKPAKPGQKKVFDWNAAYSISHRVKAALDYTFIGIPSIDKEALRAALNDVPTLFAFAMVKIVYKKEYAREIENDLDKKLTIFDLNWRSIILTKPQR